MNASPMSKPADAAGDAFDRLMRDFYRKEMPTAFPPLNLGETMPAHAVAAPRERSSLLRSRIVLAISVAAVALGFVLALAKKGESTFRPSGSYDGSKAVKKNSFGR